MECRGTHLLGCLLYYWSYSVDNTSCCRTLLSWPVLRKTIANRTVNRHQRYTLMIMRDRSPREGDAPEPAVHRGGNGSEATARVAGAGHVRIPR
jgi:hypothetical protein